MILVDTSVWVDHLRAGDAALVELLDQARVLSHPFIVGELALGRLRQREIVLQALLDLPQAVVARDDEVLRLIDSEALSGLGIGYVDAHLLASAKLTAGARLWTRDKRLQDAATRSAIAADLG